MNTKKTIKNSILFAVLLVPLSSIAILDNWGRGYRYDRYYDRSMQHQEMLAEKELEKKQLEVEKKKIELDKLDKEAKIRELELQKLELERK
jgi:hypothetical protein